MPADKPKTTPTSIRSRAKELGLMATKSRKDCKWYFSDANDLLVSDQNGLNDEQAVAFLEQRGQS